jgi:hypothetical protein
MIKEEQIEKRAEGSGCGQNLTYPTSLNFHGGTEEAQVKNSVRTAGLRIEI